MSDWKLALLLRHNELVQGANTCLLLFCAFLITSFIIPTGIEKVLTGFISLFWFLAYLHDNKELIKVRGMLKKHKVTAVQSKGAK